MLYYCYRLLACSSRIISSFFGQPKPIFLLGYLSRYTVSILLGSILLPTRFSAVQFTKLVSALETGTMHFCESCFII